MKSKEQYPSDFKDKQLRERVQRMYEDLHYAKLDSHRYDNCRELLNQAAASLEKLLKEVLV